MNNKPAVDYYKILSDSGMPLSEEQARAEFNKLVQQERFITNRSNMSPFYRLISAIVIKPWGWIVDLLVNTVLANAFLITAKGKFLDLFAWAVNLERKTAIQAAGIIAFVKSDIKQSITIKKGTIIHSERINDASYHLVVDNDVTIPADILEFDVMITAQHSGKAYNLAPGYYRILPVAIAGISHVINRENWLTVPGADVESDEDLRARIKNQYNITGHYHTDAVYRAMIANIASISADRIYFKHDAPRGPGTANAYLLLDTGVISQPFIDRVNSHINNAGHHGHGDDLQCFALPETHHNLIINIHIFGYLNLTEQQTAKLENDISNMVRAAFRENSDYNVNKTWPYSRFSFSKLAESIHSEFDQVQSVEFSLPDIISDLDIPRLKQLTVNIKNG